MSSPAIPTRPNRSAPPVARAIDAPTSGTPAISRPASELEIRCSADPSATHGIAISTAANATTQRHRARTGRRSVRTAAIGSRIAAAIAVRPSTSVAGVISVTATAMNRYGIPQITDMSPNRTRARRVIGPSDDGGRSTDHDVESVRGWGRGSNRPSDGVSWPDTSRPRPLPRSKRGDPSSHHLDRGPPSFPHREDGGDLPMTRSIRLVVGALIIAFVAVACQDQTTPSAGPRDRPTRHRQEPWRAHLRRQRRPARVQLPRRGHRHVVGLRCRLLQGCRGRRPR